MHGQARSGLRLMIRGRILLLFGLCTFLLLAAAALGFWKFSVSLHVFSEDVMSRQINAIDVEAVEINFKKQVQEWKDTLLRGKKPEALDKHWASFQKKEGEVRDAADQMSRSIAEPEAAQLMAEFLSAHKKMGGRLSAWTPGIQGS